MGLNGACCRLLGLFERRFPVECRLEHKHFLSKTCTLTSVWESKKCSVNRYKQYFEESEASFDEF